jgi:signal transduction histidine kinase
MAVTHALVRMVESELALDGGALPQAASTALAAWEVGEVGEGAGIEVVLLDAAGRLVLARPAELGEDAQRISGFRPASAMQAGSPAQGWLRAEDAQGRMRRAYYEQSQQGWAWAMLVPCSRLDPACSPLVYWLCGLVLALAVPVGMWPWYRRRAGGRLQPSPGGKPGALPQQGGGAPAMPDAVVSLDRQEHMAMMGRLAGRFAHEFNNQLGVISNSAYLIQRRADDARLALPAQAMLRAVESASQLTQRLQKLGARPCSQPRNLDLSTWLGGLESSFAMVLGKRVEMHLHVEPGPLPVHVDTDELELALTSLLLCLRETLVDGAQATLHARAVQEAGGRPLPQGEYVEICMEAWATWSARQGPLMPAAPLAWAPVDACEALDLALARRLCRASGGDAWAFHEPDRSLAVCLVLPRANTAARTAGEPSETSAQAA